MSTATSQNWRTTLSGALLAVLYSITGTHDLKHVAVSAAIALFGYLSKDAHGAN